MNVLRRSGGARPSDKSDLPLDTLDPGGFAVDFTWFEHAPAVDGDVFEEVFEVRGTGHRLPEFAVYADWVIAADGDAPGFAQSRLGLFELRAANIDTFCVDYLLRRRDDPSRYIVLGLYGDHAGLEHARSHPDIQAWAQPNPAAQWGASDESGMRFFRIVSG